MMGSKTWFFATDSLRTWYRMYVLVYSRDGFSFICIVQQEAVVPLLLLRHFQAKYFPFLQFAHSFPDTSLSLGHLFQWPKMAVPLIVPCHSLDFFFPLILLIWEAEAERACLFAHSYLLFHCPDTCSGWGWAEADVGSQELNPGLCQVGRNSSTWTITAPPRGSMCRILESEARAGEPPRFSRVGCRHPNWHLNLVAKFLPILLTFCYLFTTEAWFLKWTAAMTAVHLELVK